MPTCRSCGKEVLWRRTEAGGTMPIDALPDPSGNVVLDGDVARVLRKDLFDHAAEGPRYTSHFATCPHADRHRRKR